LLNRDAALEQFERAFTAYVARALDESPRARELCRELAARSLRIDVTGIGVAMQVVVTEHSLRLQRATAAAPAADLTLRGTPLALLSAASGDPQQLVSDGRLVFSGDDELAPRFQELARLLRPGLEAGLAKFIGRVPAHLATRGLRALQQWGRAAGRSLLDNGADYLAHESRDLVPRAEAEQFLSGVEALRQSVTRAEARVAQLSERLARP
jgi:ubiquinone biosynthesis protein UbiJ